MLRRTLFCTLVLGLGSCVPATDTPLDEAMRTITKEDLATHIRELASDEFEGRAPGTVGEERTLSYLRDAFVAMGLEPGNGATFFQEVPLASITTDPDSARFEVSGPSDTTTLAYGEEMMIWTKRAVESVRVDTSDLVFVGYGIVAPEFGWNDYDDVDAAGKTVVMLVNDPGFATGQDTLFDGRSMTYYGRWTYKFEEAARQGAEAALIIHEEDAAGYGWDVVANSWAGSQLDQVSSDGNQDRAAVEGWITEATARTLFEQGGLDFDGQHDLAASRDFQAVPLNLTARFALDNTLDRSSSYNVVARLPGAERPEEAVLYMGHWDHLGRDTTLGGDQIYNGAADNATGTAGVLEMAEAFASLATPPARSILFLLTTAEEQGLIGSAYYAAHPVVPTAQTVAAINLDVLNVIGPTRDLVLVGMGNSELDRYAREVAGQEKRVVRPDPHPEVGTYFRSDHFSLAKVGVPALYAKAGTDHVVHGRQWGEDQYAAYQEERYHGVDDEYDDDWDLTGAMEDLRLLFGIGYRLAQEDTFPEWAEDSPFRQVREEDRGDSEGPTDG